MNENQIGSQEYQNHRVFREIEEYRDFYEKIAYTCFRFVPTGITGIVNYESYIFESLRGTLDSIQLLLKAGQLTDAFALVRKYYDDVLIEIYFDVVRKEKFDWMSNKPVQDVDNWLKREQWIPRVEKILIVLKESETTSELYPFFGWDTYLKKNRGALDSTVHTSRFSNMLMNCKDVANVNRIQQLNNVSTLLKQMFTIHLAFIFHLNGHYLMATDYSEYLDVGLTPPEGLEKKMAPYTQEAFDKYIKPHEKLALFIKERCSLNIE